MKDFLLTLNFLNNKSFHEHEIEFSDLHNDKAFDDGSSFNNFNDGNFFFSSFVRLGEALGAFFSLFVPFLVFFFNSRHAYGSADDHKTIKFLYHQLHSV